MNRQSTTTAAQDRKKEQPAHSGQKCDTAPASDPDAAQDSDNPAGAGEPHQEEQWESEGGNSV